MNKYIPYWSATAAGPFTCLKNGVEVSPLAENDQEKFLNGGISYFLRLRCYNISPLYLFYSIYIYYSTIEILSLEVSHNISYFPPLLVTHHDSVTGDNNYKPHRHKAELSGRIFANGLLLPQSSTSSPPDIAGKGFVKILHRRVASSRRPTKHVRNER